jgi:hypothetical protein
VNLKEAIKHYGGLDALHAAEASGRVTRRYGPEGMEIVEVHPDLIAPMLEAEYGGGSA